MNVKTINPVYVNKKGYANIDMFWNLDGTSSADEVSAFQTWANSQGYTPALVVDGIFGVKTTAAWSALGSKYQGITPAPAKSDSTSASSTAKQTDATTSGATKKTFMQKLNEMSTTKKVIIGGAVLVVGMALVGALTHKKAN